MFCGYSIFEVKEIADKIELPVLDGEKALKGANIFLSDLEQTKGFEFDRVIIINCRDTIFPNPRLPKEEVFREVSKLYVAMTRAKKELVISYSNNCSTIFKDLEDYFTQDEWKLHLVSEPHVSFSIPNPKQQQTKLNYIQKLTGKQLLYTTRALNMTKELQNKLLVLVNGGTSFDEKQRMDSWANMGILFKYMTTVNNPHLNTLFGSIVYQELKELKENLN